MYQNRKKLWLSCGIIFLTILLNAIIIKTAYNRGPGLFWMLSVSVPLLVMSIYNAGQTYQFLRKQFIENLQPFIKQTHFDWLSHSIYPGKIEETGLRVLVGNDQCKQPYNSCILTIRSIKMVDPQKLFIQSIKNEKPAYFKNTGEERLRTCNLAGDDLVWQIGPDYSGCWNENGNFDSKTFKQLARRPEVKMIEMVLPSVIKPRYSVDSFLDIEDRTSKKRSGSGFQYSAYTTFSEAEGMIHFLGNLRELSGGKPIGVRLCINEKKDFHEICYAIRKTELIPDFVVVEGSVEKNGIVQLEQTGNTAIPLYEALLFVSKTLQAYSLERKIKIIAAGEIISAFDILKMIALGANAVCAELPDNSSNKYPANGRNEAHLIKDQKVADFHNSLMKTTVQIMKAYGFRSSSDITLAKLFRKLNILQFKNAEALAGPIVYSGSVKKIYNSKTKPYQLQDERKKDQQIVARF